MAEPKTERVATFCALCVSRCGATATLEGGVLRALEPDPSHPTGQALWGRYWWQACAAIGAPGYDPFGPDGANLNLLIRHEPSDPVGGSVPHRSYLCNVVRAE